MASDDRPLVSAPGTLAARIFAAVFGGLLVMGLGLSWWAGQNPRLHGQYEWFFYPERSVAGWALSGAVCLGIIVLSWLLARRYPRWTRRDIVRLLAGYICGPAAITLAVAAAWALMGAQVEWLLFTESIWPTVLIIWGAGYLLAWARLSARVTLPLIAACWVAGFGLEWIIFGNVYW